MGIFNLQTPSKDGSSSGPSTEKLVVCALLVPVLGLVMKNFMTVKTTPTPSTEFGTGSMFDNIAGRYDITNRVLAVGQDQSWRRILATEVLQGGELLQRNKSVRLLDLATGTADVALMVGTEAKKYGKDTAKLSILGVDPSAKMLDVGRDKVSDQKFSDTITLKQGDARDLQFLSENEFDGATMSFGIRNVPANERGHALCQIHRALKKNTSKLCIMEFSEPNDEDVGAIMGPLFRFFLNSVLPTLGSIMTGAPREYMHLQNSIKHFPSPSEFKALMESVECGPDKKGSFKVEKVKTMFFGTPQIYVAVPTN